ncbi:LrgB family protein [Carnobacterium divergens]|nr:LrgB family protein [Carnobacterium divergens]AOA00180.1 hypothetical protein BFC22_08690 [Carnobacterium divergens]MDO0874043.1 LrgB family protein [Carnobacterium divergens]MDT1957542.1 LrgB family protein [Carnobacterium divergens]MDT1973745.1 LrgB family protein [Carnobacterium divergens]MDT1996528.1 LrgB family protein [Carnobacterium divergens]
MTQKVYQELTSNPMFGLILSIAMYLGALAIFKRFPFPLLNPLVLATIFIILFLKITKIPYENYYKGGEILNILITPATVALGIPLYNTFHLLKKHVRSIMTGILLGTITSTFFTGILAVLFHLKKDIMVSIMPKSVTTAIALGISEKMHGIATVTLVIVIITGIIGSIIGPSILKALKVTDPVAQGVALGSAAHAIGTSRALELGPIEGAMSGLAIGVTGVVTVFVAPLMTQLVLALF